MISPILLRFPDATALIEKISNNPVLKDPYNQEKGITKAIAEIAGARFSNKKYQKSGVQMGVQLIIHDLQTGKDGYTGHAIPNLGILELSPSAWVMLATALEETLLECAY